MRTLLVTCTLCLAATPAFAQSAAPAAAGAANVAGVRFAYDLVKGYVTRAADQMPEEHFAFKPTPEVRSFGALLGHIANANYMICSVARGEASPNAADFEKTTAKADLAKAVRDSFAYCDAAFGMSDAQAAAMTKLFGRDITKLGVLSFNAAHDFEHYGNIVTYMRLKGLVPPSSAGSGG